jgi:hypothetical protein
LWPSLTAFGFFDVALHATTYRSFFRVIHE